MAARERQMAGSENTNGITAWRSQAWTILSPADESISAVLWCLVRERKILLAFPPSMSPLRKETGPIHGIKIHLREHAIRQAFIEPGHIPAKLAAGLNAPVIELPPLEIHQMLVLE